MRRMLPSLMLLALLACSDAETKVADTQITLTLDGELSLRNKLDTLRATLYVEESGTWTRRSTVEIPANKLRWPLDIPILPRAGDDNAQLEVIVEALAGGKRLAQTRVVTRFENGSVGSIVATLYECPGQPEGFVCAEDTCHGDGCTICSTVGDCVAVTPMPPNTTPEQDAGQVRVDASEEPTGSTGEDAAVQAQDAQVDAAAQSSEDAAIADAGPTPTACPADACPVPYACVPTPAGYTCRGLHADWPVADAQDGAKVKPSFKATPDTTTDNVTGLVWQAGHPRIYPGCTEYSMGSAGNGDRGELCTRVQAQAYCNNLIHADADDWRLPTIMELASILDLMQDGGRYALDLASFSDTQFGPYVSDSVYAGAPTQAWGANFYARNLWYDAAYAGKVRCVRGGNVPSFATPADRYEVDQTADAVLDRATGLVWQRSVSPTQYTLETIATACTAPYRVPTTKELISLVDFSVTNPAIDVTAFPGTTAGPFLAAATVQENYVDFKNGTMGSWSSMGNVRCVR